MRPLFLRRDATLPPATLVVDCGLAGAATYSHWQGAPPTPPELLADTSTGILCRAAQEPRRWLGGFRMVANDHVDADGLLAAAVACAPEIGREYHELLVAAAAAGDFSTWTGEPGFRLMLRVHQIIRDRLTDRAGGEQQAYEQVVAALPALISQSAHPDAERDAQVAQVLTVRRRLLANDGFAVTRAGALVSIAWRRRLGHINDTATTVYVPDDLPVWAIDAVAGDGEFQLLAMETADGCVYQLDAPRHSWARTVQRPTVAWRDLQALAAQLQARERQPVRWVAGGEARKVGFVCQLASVAGGLPAASSLALGDVRAACAAALASA
jgi:hypothetical protein